MCQFYRTAEDLTDVLLPYFKSGLENGQFCVWITCAPLLEGQAKEALRGALPELDRFLETGQLEIMPHDAWYLNNGSFDSQTVIEGWLAKLSDARARGYGGMRTAGNLSWLDDTHWQDFMDYERAVDIAIGGHEMAAICSYSLDTCQADDIREVAGIHRSVLVKSGEDWQLIDNADLRLDAGGWHKADRSAGKTREIFTARIETVSLSFRVVFGTDAGSGDYVACVEELAGGETPAGVPACEKAEIRAPGLREAIGRCEEEIHRRGEEIVDRGGLPRLDDSGAP